MTVSHTIHIVSLGCARNRVDSETMLGRFAADGWTVCPDPADAEVIVVNTCSFVQDAVEESIDTILELAAFKDSGRCRRLVVTGCLPERFREGLAESMAEVDIFLGTGAYDRILPAIRESLASEQQICLLPDPETLPVFQSSAPRTTTTGPMAYLKIAEGCSQHCTYCMIPKLRGRHRSRPVDQILSEARALIAAGIRELVLVAQETTAYGFDFNPPASLAGLLEPLSELNPDGWIRFLYGHPESIDGRVLDVVAAHENICAYFDIPIQHASDAVLKRMGRRYTQADLRRLFENIRQKVPGAVLRTTTIVGFPGETEKDFRTLVDFVKAVRFDHLGAFTYSDAPELPAHKLSGHIGKQKAVDRQSLLMDCQADISLAHNLERKGKSYTVLVEGVTDKGRSFGRTFFQAPEVDGITYISDQNPPVGSFVGISVKDVDEYDLVGEVK